MISLAVPAAMSSRNSFCEAAEIRWVKTSAVPSGEKASGSFSPSPWKARRRLAGSSVRITQMS
ncbi:MAG: hypothetical protein WDN69_12980 [Aliidongia sp.]